MSKVVVANDCAIEAIALLKSMFANQVEVITQRELTREDLQHTEALLVRSGTRIDNELLARAAKLKVVVSATAGFDHIDLEAMQARGVVAMFCPSAHTESTAQLTIAHCLNLTRSLVLADKAIRKDYWRTEIKRKASLEDMQLGVVGFGRIGQRVAELAQAFKMKVVAYDPYVEGLEFEKHQVEPLSFVEVIKTSDIVSLHVPLTQETRHLVNEKTLEHFNPKAYLINASRGGVINETELAVKMREGVLSGAALDVFVKEPLRRQSPLMELSNVLLSAHMGAYTSNALEKGSMEAARKIINYLQNGKVSDSLPPKQEWAKHLLNFDS
jgi:D-3-phosphoglycerate dehydrogenase